MIFSKIQQFLNDRTRILNMSCDFKYCASTMMPEMLRPKRSGPFHNGHFKVSCH